MIPILYESNETTFSNNGLGRLADCITCTVTEERNGIYECDFTYPVNGPLFSEIRPGRIILARHDDSNLPEPFDIVSSSMTMDGVASFHAVHISYRLADQVAWATGINDLGGALSVLRNVSGTPFTFVHHLRNEPTGYAAAFDGVPRSVRQLLGGIEGSILDTYGGEIQFSRFVVTWWRRRGVDRDWTIRYGVNLTEYSDETNYQGTYNSVVPYWIGDSNGKQVIVRGSRVDSDYTTYNERRLIQPMDLSDKFEAKPTTTDLNAMAYQLIQANQPQLPSQTITVDFIRIQETEEYAHLAALLKCDLCDTINVSFPAVGMSGRYKIVKIVWDVLANRAAEMELGTPSTSLAEALGIAESAKTYATSDDLAVTGDLAVAGDATIAGSLAVGGHATAIGYQTNRYSGTSNMASGTTWVATGRALSLGAGTWLVEGSIAYAANATGRRGAEIYAGANIGASQQTQAAISGAATHVATSATIVLTATTTVYLYGFQNSGSSLSQTSYMVATRIA